MFEIKRGIVAEPFFLIIYGVPGIGKTYLASKAPNCIIADMERGSSRIDCSRVEIKDFVSLLKFCAWVAEQPFETVTFDTLTAIDKLVTEFTCKENKWKNLNQPGFGQGHVAYRSNWQRFINGCTHLVEQKKNVILLAHSKVRTANDPMLEQFDRFEFDADKNVAPGILSVVDACFFYRHQVRVMENDAGRSMGKGTGNRELYTTEKGNSLGKSRFNNLPEIIENPDEQLFQLLLKGN